MADPIPAYRTPIFEKDSQGNIQLTRTWYNWLASVEARLKDLDKRVTALEP